MTIGQSIYEDGSWVVGLEDGECFYIEEGVESDHLEEGLGFLEDDFWENGGNNLTTSDWSTLSTNQKAPRNSLAEKSKADN